MKAFVFGKFTAKKHVLTPLPSAMVLLGILRYTHPSPQLRKVTTSELFPALFITTNINTFDCNIEIPVTLIWESIRNFRLYPMDYERDSYEIKGVSGIRITQFLQIISHYILSGILMVHQKHFIFISKGSSK